MASMVLLVVAFAVAACAALLLKNWRLFRAIEKLPGPTFVPFLGTTYAMAFRSREELLHVFDSMAEQYWPIFRTWFGHIPEVHLMKAEYVEKIMTSSEQITKADIYTFLHPWLGDGLLTSTGSKWHSRRKMVTPAFHFKILENFVDVFAEKSQILVDILKTKADDRPFDFYPYITRCTLDIICETAMGTAIDAQKVSDSDYVSAVYRSGEVIMKRAREPWLRSDFIFRRSSAGRHFYKDLEIMHGFTKKVISERKLSRQSMKQKTMTQNVDDLGRKRRVAFLDMLLEASEDSQKLTDQEIQEEVDTFMFEGHDTTFLFGNSLGDVPVGQSSRCSGGYQLPKGAMAMLHIRKVHQDPEHWPDPERFDPDRFLPENAQGRHPYAYVPFSAGLRNCIGQRFAVLEEKTVLSYILRNFRVKAVEGMGGAAQAVKLNAR
uniref:CYP450 n=1 Tax=Locusta migratoria TaxID=7004 RepID=A0A6F8H278_LOCMI|nr:CYP450 [Locusta migratoria]